uniref:Rap guanine nucleotide exchange factor n=1 Tax=Daphnia magna TaxID=35525 RepID=A0A0P6DK24_9CRUS
MLFLRRPRWRAGKIRSVACGSASETDLVLVDGQVKGVMQKYTRSSRSTTRGSSIESTEESAADIRPSSTAARQAVVAIPEPIRRWHSFHSRRSSFGHSAAPHLPVVVTGSGAAAAPIVASTATAPPPATKPAARFLSPPPLTPRRRFSVCFGKRSGVSIRRPNECLILEPSEMLVVDYSDVPQRTQRSASTSSATASYPSAHLHHLDRNNRMDNDQYRVGDMQHHPLMNHHHHRDPGTVHVVGGGMGTQSHRSSRGSDTSSAYSGSDTMHSSVPSSDQDAEGVGVDGVDHDGDEVDLTGLMESIVDSDEEEDLAESIDSLTVRDKVRECLEKDPSDRTDDDIEILLEFTQHLMAFANMTLSVRRALCRVMVFAVVEKAGTVVMNDGEELDSWSVIINGHVEIDGGASGEPGRALHLGDSFGITPTMDKLYHRGVMRTKCDDCQFVCITQTDYFSILHKGEENTRRHEENGRVVLVTEQRAQIGAASSSQRSHIVIKGTVERLMSHLLEDSSGDPSYVEDFLLTHRIFIDSPLIVCSQLLECFNDPTVRDKVTRVVLLWVNNHFTDFETDPCMMEFLETFECLLEQSKMQSHLRMLDFASAAKARSRTVTLTRPSRDEILHFSILGGFERGFGIFVAKVEKGSKAEEVGLKRGDQILEVNGQSFEHVSHVRALEILRASTHLSITVRSNLHAFKEMLNTPDNSPRPRGKKLESKSSSSNKMLGGSSSDVHSDSGSAGNSCPSPCKDKTALIGSKSAAGGGGFMTLGHKTKLKQIWGKVNQMARGKPGETAGEEVMYGSTTGSADSGAAQSGAVGSALTGNSANQMYMSHSNPDLTSICYDDPRADYPEHALKVFKADQSSKYLLIHKETTAREVVMLSLQEFQITDPSSNYSLCEVTVTDSGIIKQRRLPDQLQNLAERIGVASRYYLKNNHSTETLVPDELAGELMLQSQVQFLHLNAVEVAVQLTLQDFAIFTQIESTEYVDDLFQLRSKYGTPHLSQFSELVNREMFWVVTEICAEHNLMRRMRAIKQFIKVARQCKECKNFNSMFNIISGLGHGAVSRLKQTWEKLPGKYQRLFRDMQDLMDPSRNMSKYRNLINSEHVQPPMIPFFPVVKKDLTFIHLGNDTRVDGLINFEKLRMIAKEVRSLSHMCSAPYDLFTMLQLGGQPPSAAMMAMNQLTTGSGMAGGAVHHDRHHLSSATVKRRKKSAAMPNSKKMFEEAQMVRRVKAYLGNMKVITDEEQLRHMSVEVEPPAGGNQLTATSSSSGSSAGSGGGGGSESRATGALVLSAVNHHVRKRHPSPTLSTTSTASSTSATSESRRGQQGPKFGAASPQSVRKMLALSEPSKTRPYQAPNRPMGACSVSMALPLPGSGLLQQHSPSPSPGLNRRVPGVPPQPPPLRTGPHERAHERSHSDAALPVDLNAESSSVTSLANLAAMRKSHMSGSATSSDSGGGGSGTSGAGSGSLHQPLGLGLTLGIGLGIGLGSDGIDAGYCNQFNSHSNNSAEGVSGGGHTHLLHHPSGHAGTTESPPVAPRTRVPLYPHGTQAPIIPRELPPRARRPPDYNVAAQMARMARLSRAHSHEGVTAGYYSSDPEEEDDDDEAQVSAV